MSSPTTHQRMQAEQARAYLAAVEAVEARLGASLPRFRGVQFCLADYTKPADLGQAPYYRRFPGLTAKPYWDRSEWPSESRAILARLEESHEALRAEFEAGIPRARGAFRGQSTGYHGVADRWLSYPLVKETGEPVPEAFAVFPRLARLLEELVSLEFPCKTYFALMKPGAHLTEHCGGQNIQLRMHFALRIPPGDTALRVGGIERHWENGKSLFFDDTFVHEAWNRTDQDRYILLMRLLHPELSPLERAAYFLIEEEFRGSETLRAMEAEIVATKAAESARARSVVLSSLVPSPTSSWALDPQLRSSPFVSIGRAGQSGGHAGGDPQTPGSFPRQRALSPMISAQLYAVPRPRWVTFSSPFSAH
jgi:Aspartyl/Asparaginyl beta-hydroxylase